MIRRTITLPELALIAGTRAAAGAGIGLLMAEKLSPEKRRAVGWTLLSVGVISTIPLIAQFLWGSPGGEKPAKRSAPPREEPETVEAGA